MKTNLFLTAALSLSLCAASTAQTLPSYLPTDGLVGWWPFNGNANDESGNGNDGTVNGAVLTTDRFGNEESAFNFNLSGTKISLINDNSFPGNLNYTISFWFKTQFNGNYQYVISKRPTCMGGDEQFLEFIINPSSNKISYTVSGAFGIELDFIGNEWNHFVYTKNGDFSHFYMNGNLISTINSLYEIYPNVPLGISAETACIYLFGQGNKSYIGDIDDVSIHYRALLPEEINAMYSSTPINCSENLTINPLNNNFEIGDTVSLNAITADSNPTFIWQADFGQGFQTLTNYGIYSGVASNLLLVSNVQLSEHGQPFRVLSISGACLDTSDVFLLSLTDTCITTIVDSVSVSTTDTLIINTLITAVQPAQENTFLVYPNPAGSQITINNGNVGILGGYTMRITNSAGQEVYNQNITQTEVTLDLGNWGGNGLYVLYITDPQGEIIAVKQIVLQ